MADTTRLLEDSLCPQCQGSGTITVQDGLGEDVWPLDVNCPDCKGTGGLTDDNVGYCDHKQVETIQTGATFMRVRCKSCGEHIEHNWD